MLYIEDDVSMRLHHKDFETFKRLSSAELRALSATLSCVSGFTLSPFFLPCIAKQFLLVCGGHPKRGKRGGREAKIF